MHGWLLLVYLPLVLWLHIYSRVDVQHAEGWHLALVEGSHETYGHLVAASNNENFASLHLGKDEGGVRGELCARGIATKVFVLLGFALINFDVAAIVNLDRAEQLDVSANRVTRHSTKGKKLSERLRPSLSSRPSVMSTHSNITRHPDDQNFGQSWVLCVESCQLCLICGQSFHVEVCNQIWHCWSPFLLQSLRAL